MQLREGDLAGELTGHASRIAAAVAACLDRPAAGPPFRVVEWIKEAVEALPDVMAPSLALPCGPDPTTAPNG
jgi:hypothetical protein